MVGTQGDASLRRTELLPSITRHELKSIEVLIRRPHDEKATRR